MSGLALDGAHGHWFGNDGIVIRDKSPVDFLMESLAWIIAAGGVNDKESEGNEWTYSAVR